MRYRRLGRSELEVSVVALGCWAIAGDWVWGPQDEQQAIDAIHAALDCGINLLDTAEGYGDGRSEELLAKALAGRRGKALVASKVLPIHLRPADLRAAFEASLKRLQTDYIDIYYIHWPNPEVPVADAMAVLEQLRDQGKIRVIGCSNHGVRDLGELLRVGRVEVNQLCYSLLWRAIEHEILPACVASGIGVACYSPLAQGLLTGKFRSADEVPPGRARTRHFRGDRPHARHGEAGAEEETFSAIEQIGRLCAEAGLPTAQAAMAWLLAQPGVTTVIAGARNPEQVRANAAAAELELGQALQAALTRATEGLKARFGANADMWEGKSRIH